MLKISEYMYGNRAYQKKYVKKNDQKLEELAVKGQSPQALFIGCVDSRVLPNLITDTGPGDMLIVRNVGNFVSTLEESSSETSTASAIEFAVKVLKVKEIIVCGHTQCGAVYTIYSDLDAAAFPHLSQWLNHGEKVKEKVSKIDGNFQSRDAMLRTAEKVSVTVQLENLLTYPFVKEAVDEERLKLHGWIYDIQTGEISCYDPVEDTFKRLEELSDGEAGT